MIAVDTNILIYAMDDLSPERHEQALAFLESLDGDTRPTVLPWQVVCELLAWMRRHAAKTKVSNERIREDITAVMSRFPLVYPSHKALTISLGLTSRHSLSHWDSLLVAACIEAGVDTLYSEDRGDGAVYESVTVINPLKSPGAAH